MNSGFYFLFITFFKRTLERSLCFRADFIAQFMQVSSFIITLISFLKPYILFSGTTLAGPSIFFPQSLQAFLFFDKISPPILLTA